jgi:putative thiamine transport system ATP-binding protein
MSLALEHVHITLGQRVLVERLDLVVSAGEIVTVMGPSGSGKSTLLAYIGGFLDPAFQGEGRVRIERTDITTLAAERRRIGILFQDDLLFPHLSVGANLAFGLPADVRPHGERRRQVAAALAAAGLEGFADRDPATLSGGQRARAAVLRTLLARPRALLLDEPFSRLDAELRREFRGFVFDFARRYALPTLMVTHDIADAPVGGRIVALR